MLIRDARMLLVLIVFSAGCASDVEPEPPPARVDAPIGVQMMRAVPELKNQRFNNLLSFEATTDLVFVSGAAPDTVVMDTSRPHTGRSAIRVTGGVLAVKLSSLITAGAFPGDWTLAGAYFYSAEGTGMTISCQIGGALVAQRTIHIPAGRWTPAMVDVALLNDLKALVEPGALSGIVFQWDSGKPIFCDDFVLIDNAQLLYGDERSASSVSGEWVIRRRGLNYIGTSPGRFSFKLLTADHSADGWKAEELNAKRVRFSSDGPERSVTIYNDGRAYWDGEYRPLSATMAAPGFAAQHAAPGRVDIPEEFGRVDRNTPGDDDNDGYNEARGSYQIVAAGPRLELTLTPRGAPLVRPVLEVSGPFEGKVLVTIEGRLVEDATRLPDGTLLIDIAAPITRASVISIKAQQPGTSAARVR